MLPISRFLITFAKSLLPYKVTFSGSRDEDLDISWGHYSSYHRGIYEPVSEPLGKED